MIFSLKKEVIMTKVFQIYRCNVCGNVVEVVHQGIGELVCCGQAMELLEEKTEGELATKHKPVITKDGKTVRITVSEITHPMTEDHSILFIEAMSPDGQYLKRKFLTPDEAPELEFECN